MKRWIKEAEKKLRFYQSWSTYCEGVELPDERSKERSGEPSKATPEGNFAIVRHYQREVRKTKSEVDPQAFDTPIANRTRAKTNLPLDKEMARLRLNPFETPTKQSPNQSSSRKLIPFEDESPSPGSSLISGPSPLPDPIPPNTIARELERVLYPPTKDEQIVNTALIVFLNALNTHFDFYSNWTLHRKPSVAAFENAQFEARADGYLDSPGGKTRAIVEVKPTLRSRHSLPIQMQESDQMVAWIRSNDDLAQRNNTTYAFILSWDNYEYC
ncbi:hypothetical protein N7501_007066 [Penicillium viridicatum]|nr:hypothetical protein N7501_007066 [Penicillium viridicatum]